MWQAAVVSNRSGVYKKPTFRGMLQQAFVEDPRCRVAHIRNHRPYYVVVLGLITTAGKKKKEVKTSSWTNVAARRYKQNLANVAN